MPRQKESRYYFVIGAMVFLALLPCNYNQFQASILAGELMQQMGMSAQQFAAAMTAPMLIGFFIGIPGGVLADKIGPKKSVAIAMIISTIGCFLRLVATSYGFFFIAMLLLGTASTVITICAAKLLSAWFPPHLLGAMMGVTVGAASISTALAQATTAFFSGAKSAFMFGSCLMAVMAILWIILVKDRPENVPAPEPAPVLEPLKKAMKSKNVWFITLIAVAFVGFQITIASFYPTALQERGLSLATAGLYASIFTIGSFCGNIIIPNIAAKIGLDRPSMLVSALLGMGLVIVGWNFCDGIVMALVIALGSVFACGILPIVLSYPAFLPEIGAENVGSASGVITTVEMLAAFVLPSYVIIPLCSGSAGINYSMMFVMTGVCCGIQGIVALFLPELGRKAMKKEN